MTAIEPIRSSHHLTDRDASEPARRHRPVAGSVAALIAGTAFLAAIVPAPLAVADSSDLPTIDPKPSYCEKGTDGLLSCRQYITSSGVLNSDRFGASESAGSDGPVIHFDAYGAPGGKSSIGTMGGFGAKAAGGVDLREGYRTFVVDIGQPGADGTATDGGRGGAGGGGNGGGGKAGGGGGGGGASWITAFKGLSLDSAGTLLAKAAGGGGAGAYGPGGDAGQPGTGMRADVGKFLVGTGDGYCGGGAGTADAAGAAGGRCDSDWITGTAGSAGAGGTGAAVAGATSNGAMLTDVSNARGGGGGGGGVYGGGGGGVPYGPLAIFVNTFGQPAPTGGGGGGSSAGIVEVNAKGPVRSSSPQVVMHWKTTPASTTSIALSSSTVAVGSAVRAKVTVRAQSPALDPDGAVQLQLNDRDYGSAVPLTVTRGRSVNSMGIGTASVPVGDTTSVGDQQLSARYVPSSRSHVVPSASAPVTLSVLNAAPAIKVTSSSAYATDAKPAKLTATLASDATGTVTFTSSNGTTVGTAPVTGGVARVTARGLSKGPNTISASYSGGKAYMPSSTSNTLVLNYLLTPEVPLSMETESQLFSRPNKLWTTLPVDATGTVAFYDKTSRGDAPLGKITLVAGKAVLDLPAQALAVGTHQIYAFYTGDDRQYTSATSTPTELTVRNG